MAHKDMFAYCLKLLSDSLRRDNYDLNEPETLISDMNKDRVNTDIHAGVQYACRYWVSHLVAAGIGLRDDASVHTFSPILHWVEALNLTERETTNAYLH